MQRLTLARSQGIFNLLNGLWPLLHMRSFEAVFGPKTDKWLVRTVACLLMVNGMAQLRSPASKDGLDQAQRIGVGTAASLAAVDLACVPAGRISKMYLVDAVAEIAWIGSWLRARR
jgi:hypothetical protein